MSTPIIYHNPRCSKSRQTLDLLKEKGYEPIIVEYLKTPPGKLELNNIVKHLELDDPRDLMRKNEAPYKDYNLDDESLSRMELITAMVKNPILIERPIVVVGKKAAIGRPPENILQLLT